MFGYEVAEVDLQSPAYFSLSLFFLSLLLSFSLFQSLLGFVSPLVCISPFDSKPVLFLFIFSYHLSSSPSFSLPLFQSLLVLVSPCASSPSLQLFFSLDLQFSSPSFSLSLFLPPPPVFTCNELFTVYESPMWFMQDNSRPAARYIPLCVCLYRK